MKQHISFFLFQANQFKQAYMPWIIFFLTITMLVIGSGAPDDGGGAGCPSCPWHSI